ncbi:hypothetical protein NLM33_13525 [Bradyrhizobium sp. CCGUVB1N3]|uniref:hypothetical protein n=1 Tax=Bradyrhizobium sp. CCGUVB1N3 TaxID=2949629 RepID=UPI0020B2C707|nr:hypothetical protein [Bradyrhizobium sp. CCGUVB1N3]MCP3471352.1 hypothetical protein [Bradyrhizobium sp. CCGUVB1N3]
MSNVVSTVFEHARVPYGDDGRLVRGIIARCGAPNCEAAVPLPVNVMANGRGTDSNIEWQFIARKLEQKGWRIGKTATAHRCPKCFNAAKFAAIRKSEEKPVVTKIEPPLQVVQENARVMTREDRRIVFEKLNEVYIDGKVGYGRGWTDEKVATDLGVPRAWVRVIREENFGDEVGNEEIRDHIMQAGKLLLDIKALRQPFDEAQRLFALADKIEKSLSEIQKVLK